MTNPIDPHEALNIALKTPAVDPDGARKLEIATKIYIEILRPTLQTAKNFMEEDFKIAANISVGAAEVLLAKLGGR